MHAADTGVSRPRRRFALARPGAARPRLGRWRLLGAAALALAMAPAAMAQSTPSPPYGTSAVVLVGGFNSSSPFSTPACATTDRGPTWGVATGPAAALSAAGEPVFTAPIANAGQPVAASCLGGANTPDIPGSSVVIDSNGPLADNQAALVAFLGFLNQSYGITTAALVGHSDGGLWSRAAISALRASGSPITVTSLTTVGTPHTGSFGADLVEAVNADGGSCSDLSNSIEQAVCEAVYDSVGALLQDLGPDVIEELSSSWLAQWNPTTTIGCPVTTLAGTYVDLGLRLAYYTPNDGIVGEASALNQGTWVPLLNAARFTPVPPPGGNPQTFDVVHSESLSFLSSNTELNTPAVGTAIAASVQSPPAGQCLAASGGASALRAGATPRAAARPVTVTLPLRHREAVHTGPLSRPRRGEALVLLRGASVRCGTTRLPAAPLLGSSAVRVVAPRCAQRLTVRGRALRLAPTASSVRMTRDGSVLRWRIAGGRLRHVRTQLRVDGRWRTAKDNHVTVPAAAHEPALRIRGTDRHGRIVRAATRIAV